MLVTPAIRGFDRPTYAIQADHVAPIEGDRVAAQAGATANLIAERPDLVDLERHGIPTQFGFTVVTARGALPLAVSDF